MHDRWVSRLQTIDTDNYAGDPSGSFHRPFFLLYPSLQLRLNQLKVPPSPLHQLLMRARLNDDALLHHKDDIRALDRREAVSYRDRQSSLGRIVQRTLHVRLALSVQRTRRLWPSDHSRTPTESDMTDRPIAESWAFEAMLWRCTISASALR